jgi:phage shock protein C
MNASDTSPEAETHINDQIPNDKPAADDQPGNGSGSSSSSGSGSQSYSSWQPQTPGLGSGSPMHRPLEGRMLFGVCAGIAQYLNVDVNVVRIVFAVLTVIGGAGIPVYLAGWLLLPEEGAEQSIASEFIGSLQGRSR